MKLLNKTKKRAVYCHFSFRRPRGKDYGIFAAALYADSEGKILVAAKVRAYKLWKDQQYITAIQSYEHALYCLWEWQNELIKRDIYNVFLVTTNSALAGWIKDPNKNKSYTYYMNRANYQYKTGGAKELQLTVGLSNVRDYEKSRKFCVEEKISNRIPTENNRNIKKDNKIKIDEYKSALDIIKEETPEGVSNLKEIGESFIID